MGCRDCGAEGTLDIHGSLKTCKTCGGKGRIPAFEEALRVIRQFRVQSYCEVSHEQSVSLRFSGYDTKDVEDRVLQTLCALSVGRIKARIIFPV